MRSRSAKLYIERIISAGFLCALLALLLSACAGSETPAARTVRIVLEEGAGYTAAQYVYDSPAGESLDVELQPENGFTVTGCDYPGAVVADSGDGSVRLTIPEIRYTRTVCISTEKNPFSIRYHLEPAGSEEVVLALTYPATHERINTAAGDDESLKGSALAAQAAGDATGTTAGAALSADAAGNPEDTVDIPEDTAALAEASRSVPLLSADGCALLTGWTTGPEGTGERISLGSRADVSPDIPLELYADWESFSPARDFEYEVTPSGQAAITGYLGQSAGQGGTAATTGQGETAAGTGHEETAADAGQEETAADAGQEETTADAGHEETAADAGQEETAAGQDSSLSLVIPAYLDGHLVTAIREGAFAGLTADSVVLPPTLREVSPRAFENAALSELIFYDSLTNITDYAFAGCENLRTIRINAVRPPVYSGSYYDTFTDKMDRLRGLSGTRKIILFSGSSARFGYDCALIDAAFPDYAVANLGVFAYTNALPQLDLIRHFAGEGDILLHSPEFDASRRQFCTTNAMDSAFFRMIESDYDLLTLLNYRDYGGLLSAFSTYQKEREGMDAGDYRTSAAAFDEDHFPVAEPSYNEYGDYILPRPNATDDTPIYDLPVEYTAAAFPREAFIEPLNAVYDTFLENGVRVLFTYAPRNRDAVSDKSTPEARAALDAYFRETLCVPVISDIEESLYPGRYLYGTDNHLSTEGVRIRTERIIRDLTAALEKEEMP